MNHSIYSADRATHLKIVVIALGAGIAIVASSYRPVPMPTPHSPKLQAFSTPPFGANLFDAAQQELPEPSCLFDLSEDGFNDLLTQSVATSVAGALELGVHLGNQRAGS